MIAVRASHCDSNLFSELERTELNTGNTHIHTFSGESRGGFFPPLQCCCCRRYYCQLLQFHFSAIDYLHTQCVRRVCHSSIVCVFFFSTSFTAIYPSIAISHTTAAIGNIYYDL